MLSKFQAELKAPKGQRNKFGNYNYRSCEDILEAVKECLHEENCVLGVGACKEHNKCALHDEWKTPKNSPTPCCSATLQFPLQAMHNNSSKG